MILALGKSNLIIQWNIPPVTCISWYTNLPKGSCVYTARKPCITSLYTTKINKKTQA